MSTIRGLATVVSVLIASAGATAVASEQSTDIHPNTAFQYWKDPCGYPNVIPSRYGAQISRLLEAEALLVPAGQIERRTDDPNYFRLNSTRPNVNWGNTNIPMGADAPFLGETQLATAGRSGYLMAPNIVATAAHTNDFNPYSFVVVFDMRSTPVPGAVPLQCSPPDPEHIPAANVYYPRPTNALIANTILYYSNIYGAWTGVDYAAFYLDRAVSNRRYLRVRDTGGISEADQLTIASHPNRLRTKLLFGFGYAGEETNYSFPDFTFPTFDDFYLWEGMSGAAVYNVDRGYVETSVGAPHGAGCVAALAPGSFYNPGPDYAIYDLCDDNPVPDLQPFHEINEGPITTLAALVPTPYLRVAPLDDVTYVMPLNGTPSPSQTAYTVRSSSSETSNTSVIAFVEAPPAGEPQLLQIGSYTASMAPGTTQTITATATLPTGVACGVYDRYLDIGDNTHSFNDRMRHRFEVGMTAFDVAPAEDREFYAITSPPNPSQIAYTLTNTRPTATTVQIAFDQTWAKLSALSGNANGISLAAAGQTGSTKTVYVTLAPSAYSLPDGDHVVHVDFNDQSGCALQSSQRRNIVFHKGTLVISQELGVFVPVPTPPASPVQSTINVSESFCISDMSVQIDTASVGATIGQPLSQWAPNLLLDLTFTGLTSRSLSLWHDNALPVGWTIPSYYDDILAASIEPLLLDEHGNTPPTGVSLAQFNGRDPKGQWTFSIVDNGQANRSDALLARWQLRFAGTAGTCPN